MDGALMEVGPYRLKDNSTLEYNEGSWDEFGNLLFVDQPVGTGFSYVNGNQYLHEMDEMAAHFITFLENWFDIFPEYERDDVWIHPPTLSLSPSLILTLYRSISPENRSPDSTFRISRKPSRSGTKKRK